MQKLQTCGNLTLMITKNKKERVMDKTKIHDKDTGSPEVQIAILTERIEELSSHLKKHKKDSHSRRGLLQMVADRQKHMKYLKEKAPKRLEKVVKKLNLKKKKA